jgi:hypothetical protein
MVFGWAQTMKWSIKKSNIPTPSLQSDKKTLTRVPKPKVPWVFGIILDLGRYLSVGTLATRIRKPKAARASKARVTNVFKLLQMLHDGKPVGDKLLIKRSLTGTEYKQLLKEIAKDQELRAYVDNKVR